MTTIASPAELSALVSGPAPTSIDQVIATLRRLDAALPPEDGLKWFNLLYLLVTEEVRDAAPAGGWLDARWLERLDVVFAGLYFQALNKWLRQPALAPRSWRAVFAARGRPCRAPLRFALAGMNAHINHDLPLAVVRTCEALHVAPGRGTPQHRDFEGVNGLLAQVEPRAAERLLAGALAQLADCLGTADDAVAMWNVRKARETAWSNAEVLWHLRGVPPVRDRFVEGLDRLTGLAGRGLLAGA